MSDRNKIAQELTVEQLDAFVHDLADLPGKERTLAAIQERAATMGIRISLMSAKAFRDVTFERYLDTVRLAQETALEVENIETGGNTFAKASAKMLGKRIFDKLLRNAEDPDAIDENEMSLAIARLRQAEDSAATLQTKIKALEVAQLNAAQEALKHVRDLRVISENKSLDEKEKIERVRLKLFGPAPQTNESGKQESRK